MRASRNMVLVRWISAIVLCIAGCDETTGPPAPGAIFVIVSPSGTDVVTFGYRASLDNGQTRSLDSLTSRATFFDVEPGPHTVRLEGLAPNCSVVGQNPMPVTVVSEIATTAQFNVSCVANVGTLRVTTVTTGSGQDPDGYVVMVDGVQRSAIGANAAVAIADLRVGQHQVSLAQVASNCRVSSQQSVSVNVTFQATVDVLFNIQCAAPGSLMVTVVTTGIEIDADGYTVAVHAASVEFTESRNVATNSSVTFTPLWPATDYRVTLQGVSANCDVAGTGSRTVAVTEGVTTSVTFEISCEAPSLLALVRRGEIYVINSKGTGAVRLTTDGSGSDHPAWSSTGRIAFVTHRHGGDPEIYVMNDDGTNQVRLTTSVGDDHAPSWSPDGSKIVFRSIRSAGESDLWVMNADGSGLTRLTTTESAEGDPAWSSTGKIAFISDRDHPQGEIYVMNADGTNVVRLTNDDLPESSPAWSPDGSMIAFARQVECYYGCPTDIFVMNADGSNQTRLATGWATYQYHSDPAWAPNGQAIAFTRQYCDYYTCDSPQVWIVDLHGTQLGQITDHAANPAWKP
jgi:Tol biopolymer transport system component